MGGKRDGEAFERAAALAAFTAHMHNEGVLHKDFSPGNILWDKDEKGYHFAVIDINRMEFKQVDINEGCANFARLWGITDIFRTMARTYAKARNFDVDECERLVVMHRNKFWKNYGKRHYISFPLD